MSNSTDVLVNVAACSKSRDKPDGKKKKKKKKKKEGGEEEEEEEGHGELATVAGGGANATGESKAAAVADPVGLFIAGVLRHNGREFDNMAGSDFSESATNGSCLSLPFAALNRAVAQLRTSAGGSSSAGRARARQASRSSSRTAGCTRPR